MRSAKSSTLALPTFVTTSPAASPACWAGEPAWTWPIWAPAPLAAPPARATLPVTPSTGLLAVPFCMISCATRVAWSIGIAKPSPMLPPWPCEPLEVAMAELMPTTCPSRLTSGPPELPGLIGASVCRPL